MYHKVTEQELHPENYFLKEIDLSTLEDECFDLISEPRHTQRTIGLYLKRIRAFADEESILNEISGAKDSPPVAEAAECREKKRFSLAPGSEDLEKEVYRNKGFWVGRPELSAPLTYKLREKYSVDIKRKTKREQGIFYRPKYLELDHVINLAKAGLLYSDEEISDSEEEVQPDVTSCLPLRKVKYKLCDPCKEKKEKREEVEGTSVEDSMEERKAAGVKPPFKKIPTGCQCDYYGVHNQPPSVWDYPFKDEVDMQRQHEMNKALRPFRNELLNKYYEKNPPVKFMAHEPGMKRTFPVYQISNL